MRLPVSLLTLAVFVVECVARSPASAQSPGAKGNDQVLNYFNKLLPVANRTILHELGGPDIGAAVYPRPLSALNDIFF
jgi:hypothetical protein